MKLLEKFNYIKTEFIRLWEIYLDDCFIFWKCPSGNIGDFHNFLQNLHPKIKFTMEHSFKELLFLHFVNKNQIGQIISDPQIYNNHSIWIVGFFV